MPIGITQITNVTLQNLTDLANFTDPIELYINVNRIVYGGMYFFAILWIAAVILYLAMQEFQDQPLINAMNAMAVITIVSLFWRAIQVLQDGIFVGFLTDYQMWVFPILTAVLAAFNYGTKER